MNKLIPEKTTGTIGYSDSKDSIWSKGDFNSDNYASALREYFQNSIDAFKKLKSNKKDKLVFKVKRGHSSFNFFDFKELKKQIDYCIKAFEANETGDDDTAISRYKKISKLCKDVKDKKIESIIFEDNGIGLGGDSRLSMGNKETGWSRMTGDDISDKGHGELGSFGMGKATAFSLADYLTTFYLSNYNGKTRFIGYTKLGMTYGKEGLKKKFGPKSFFGKEEEDEDKVKYADITEASDEIKKYRSIDNSGLTTIIPVNDFLKRNDIKDFVDFTLHVLFHSFFSWFTNNNFEIEIYDEKLEKKVLINEKNYKEIISDLGESSIYEEEDNQDFKYDYELIKTFLLQDPLDDIYEEGVFDINVKKEYKGKLKVKVFENKKMETFSEQKSRRKGIGHLKQNFRIIREGMTIRSERFPTDMTSRIEPKYCGYFYYEGDKLNELLGLLETASHDEFNYTRIRNKNQEKPNEFPTQRVVKGSFIGKSSRHLTDLLKQIGGVNQGEDKAYRIQINTGDKESEIGTQSEKVDSFYKKIKIEKTQQKEIMPEKINSSSSKGKGPLEEDPNGTEEIDGPWRKGKNGGKNGGKRKVKASRSGISDIHYLSTLLDKKGRSAKYLIQLTNLDSAGKLNLTIKQDSRVKRSSITSFIIEEIEIRKLGINGNNDNIEKRQQFDVNYSDNFIAGYKIRDIDFTNHTKAFLEIKVTEPELTSSRFKMIFEKSN